jgi:predicted DNA-binding transcriptional regulator YafY
MSYERTDDIVTLALAMQSSTEGVSLADIQRMSRCSRRTAERLRDAVFRAFPQAEEFADGSRTKRWRLPAGTSNRLVSFVADEFVELRLAADDLRRTGLASRASSVEGMALKLRALTRPQLLTRLEPDIEALLAAEGLTARPGPKPLIRSEVLAGIREALKAGRSLHILHRPRAAARGQTVVAHWRAVQPHGVLYGMRHYLVATATGKTEPYLWSLPNIEAIRDGAPLATPLLPFDLTAFAARSFGVYQEAPMDVIWRFSPAVAEDARAYSFHPTEAKEEQPDGGLIVRFRAGGAVEMCWHAFMWGTEIEMLAPVELRDRYLSLLDAARASSGQRTSGLGDQGSSKERCAMSR